MKLNALTNKLTSKVGRQILIGQKHSPKILFVAGIVGVTATVVLACRATLKVEEVLEEAQSDIEKINSAIELHSDQYTEADQKRDVAIVYIQSGLKIVKLYAPALTIGVAAVGCLVGSHAILNKRNVALTAAYAGLDRAFKEYRQRVIAEYGEDEERNLRYTELRESVEINSDGVEVKTLEHVFNPLKATPYSRFFDETSTSWCKEPEYNKVFLIAQQNYANDLLRSRGHLFLNEVYDMIGVERSKAGAVVGWVIRKNGGDNYVSFRMFDGADLVKRDFVNGNERSILLDFNVDGVILDLI